MNIQQIHQILSDTAYVRTGGSPEELKCAEYLVSQCARMGLKADLEEFGVEMSVMKKAVLLADGQEIPCRGYFCSGSGEVTAPLCYMPNDDAGSLAECRGKIVLVDGNMGYWKYQDLVENGAAGFITYAGNANFADEDIDQRTLRAHISRGNKIPGVSVHTKSAVRMISDGTETVTIHLEQEEYTGKSHNVILDLPGQLPEYIAVTAHYDSTSLSQGAYDNMSGSIGLLDIAEKFADKPHRYGLRFIWCGCEERGLSGSKAYTAAHEAELKSIVLNVNLDMLGCIMGKFIACCTAEEKLVHYTEYLAGIAGFGINARQDVYSSDSTAFADKGIPAITFARIAPQNIAPIHNRYDTMKVLKPQQLLEDLDFISLFVENMANAGHCPVSREIPKEMKEKLDIFLSRKREKK